MKIRIITPTFNEKENILIIYESIKKVMANLNIEYDHVVIDNNSYDGTYEILRNIASIDKSFKVIINQKISDMQNHLITHCYWTPKQMLRSC